MAREVFKPDINSACRYEEFREKFMEMVDKPCNWLEEKSFLNSPICGNKRFYVSPKKYYIRERYESLGVDLIELSTKEHYFFNPVWLLRKFEAIDQNGFCYEAKSKAAINRMMYDKVKDVRPYITNGEFVDTFLKIVGNNHIYFEETKHRVITAYGKKLRVTIDCLFVKIPT